ncbi:MAG: response regulator, partial [Planctomycetes bacterium]|nr:response regulator [Planctomycetota bacterium]
FEGKSVGIKVRRIIDVTENTGSFSGNAGSRPGVLGAGVLQGRTTVFLDIFRMVQDTVPDMFEKNAVSLGSNDNLSGKHALVVDDSHFFRSLESSYLKAEGMTVEQAADPRIALELIADHDFDLFVFDIEMPHMDGIELTRRVREIAGQKYKPILVVSGALDDRNRKRVEDAGATGYRNKLDHRNFMEGVVQVIHDAREKANA